MELAYLRRATTPTSALILVLVYGVLLACPLGAQEAKGRTTPADRPGDAPYTPTKLEWAAVELQASYGTTWTREDPVAKAYVAASDGTTIRCILQYTPNVSAEDVKTTRDVTQIIFDKYATNRGWPWLRLRFEEKVLPQPH